MLGNQKLKSDYWATCSQVIDWEYCCAIGSSGFLLWRVSADGLVQCISGWSVGSPYTYYIYFSRSRAEECAFRTNSPIVLINDKVWDFFSSDSLGEKPLIITAHDLLRKCFSTKSMQLRVRQDEGRRKSWTMNGVVSSQNLALVWSRGGGLMSYLPLRQWYQYLVPCFKPVIGCWLSVGGG